MGANDSPTTTRSIVTDYFDWRLNNKITNNRLFLIVRKIASDCETAYHSQQPTFNIRFSLSSVDLQTLNNIRNIHNEIANELFSAGGITWGRIITFISFSALLAEHIIRQQQLQQQQEQEQQQQQQQEQQPSNNSLLSNLIISSIIDWTTDFIDTDLQTWLQNQNYWTGFFKLYDKASQRRNSIGRYAGILGTIG
ncbi:unnamed protein product [Rotaria sp. Silwood2]|nr:unnamed protein product [Rotaria sp. Silwood2]CAF2569855.1 unnamed protein product [Rotaria sp. Silwood2]CAF2814759.1 unnamed protein product [Rotaria sp. Silwood2]CAF2963736.1 unnamed protein product [Rotaria sp. Silwood2]CAF3913978.1 unnamed protein product [Rotaria sp. Silwood2]